MEAWRFVLLDFSSKHSLHSILLAGRKIEGNAVTIPTDLSIGVICLQNQIQFKNWVWIKAFFLKFMNGKMLLFRVSEWLQ